MTVQSTTKADIAIIGGGIAGSSAAIVLRRAGYDVVLVEREEEFRDRVRGEACHPWGVRELENLGLRELVREHGAVDLPYWTQYRNREFDSRISWPEMVPGSPPELGFNHVRLQTALLNEARQAGARVYRPAEATIAEDETGWSLSITHTAGVDTVHASFLIAADGKTSSTRKLWGARRVVDPSHHQFGGMLVRGLNLPRESAHQAFHEAGFTMIFPQADDLWRLYYICPTDVGRSFTGVNRVTRYMEACAACLPEGVMIRAESKGPLAFFANSHVVNTRVAGPRAVSIGDAAGAPDPTQGHGMSLIWRDVRVLRDLLADQNLDEVPTLFAEHRREYEQVLRTHAAWLAPLLTDTDEHTIALQAQVERARALDPSAMGYATIFANGPDGLPTDDEARAQFFGEHLGDSPVHSEISLSPLP